MADIQLRFHKDMLVLSAPIRTALERLGIDTVHDAELTLLLEPEIYDELYRLESMAGAQCVVTDTSSITPARLAHARMETRAEELAQRAVEVARAYDPQHVLIEVGPCGLPLDPFSKASLNESRLQYTNAARLFRDDLETGRADAFFLNGFSKCADLKCALMGIRKVSDAPILASVETAPLSERVVEGSAFMLSGGWESLDDAVEVMNEYGAQVVGFSTDAPPAIAMTMAAQAGTRTAFPMLVQLDVHAMDPDQGDPTVENPYFEPDTMVPVAEGLRGAGVQFLRAVGAATPAYTGALVAATEGDDVLVDQEIDIISFTEDTDMDALAERLRARVDAALGRDAD